MVIQPVILSGGSGTRLWPLSREYYPKQLLAPFGDQTLLQTTIGRLEGLEQATEGHSFEVSRPVVICSEEHRFLVAEQLRVSRHECGPLMLEPVGRNTAPAATLAALQANAENPRSVMLIMPADHLIADVGRFHRAVLAGGELAERGYIVTFGIVPTRAETGYGYIRKGKSLGGVASDASTVARFVEKPDAATARAYVESGDYLWNSGMFMVTAADWLMAIERFRPDILSACRDAYFRGVRDGDFYRLNKEAFVACPSDSIDYAVMERITDESRVAQGMKAAVIPLDAGWSDVGAFSSLWEVLPHDGAGNIFRGDVVAEDTRDSLLFSEHRLVAAVGLENMIVIETADAVLVVPKDKAEAVKGLVTRLKSEGRSEHQLHRRVHRPWGSYDGVDSGERFQVKRICVKPGCSLSLQLHRKRAEHWVVVRGTARVVRGEETFLLHENESTFIPLGVKHRLENPTDAPLEIIEVQSGSYLGEDDIVRFEDKYGRS
jgi:mannose-1-phosphate guanylyltransferase/mannose-6-phosphate isomerase